MARQFLLFFTFSQTTLSDYTQFKRAEVAPCLVMTVTSNQGVLSELLCLQRGNEKNNNALCINKVMDGRRRAPLRLRVSAARFSSLA